MQEKLCLFCEHLNKESQSFGSTMTGAYGENGFSCQRGHFNEFGDGGVDDIDGMRALFLRAEKCPDYSQPYLDKPSHSSRARQSHE